MLVLLVVTYFFFMATEATFLDTSLCIPEVAEVHSDVPVNPLVMLAKVFNAIAPSST